MNKRLAWIDIAKGLGIIAVVIGHFAPKGTTFLPKYLLVAHAVILYDRRLFRQTINATGAAALLEN
ncbi:hypothetical protein [Lacticaseibacillus camelliae]|uniref:hypothetical protein n=1 Tax=Lacticaseibacillus camelliae TaxID=381742 RepID=UPI00138EEDB5|nr:hypothetical protein [Lacticaseibacillus camelliae]